MERVVVPEGGVRRPRVAPGVAAPRKVGHLTKMRQIRQSVKSDSGRERRHPHLRQLPRRRALDGQDVVEGPVALELAGEEGLDVDLRDPLLGAVAEGVLEIAVVEAVVARPGPALRVGRVVLTTRQPARRGPAGVEVVWSAPVTVIARVDRVAAALREPVVGVVAAIPKTARGRMPRGTR